MNLQVPQSREQIARKKKVNRQLTISKDDPFLKVFLSDNKEILAGKKRLQQKFLEQVGGASNRRTPNRKKESGRGESQRSRRSNAKKVQFQQSSSNSSGSSSTSSAASVSSSTRQSAPAPRNQSEPPKKPTLSFFAPTKPTKSKFPVRNARSPLTPKSNQTPLSMGNRLSASNTGKNMRRRLGIGMASMIEKSFLKMAAEEEAKERKKMELKKFPWRDDNYWRLPENVRHAVDVAKMKSKHSEFWYKLQTLNDKIFIFRSIFYTKMPSYQRNYISKKQKQLEEEEKRRQEEKEQEFQQLNSKRRTKKHNKSAALASLDVNQIRRLGRRTIGGVGEDEALGLSTLDMISNIRLSQSKINKKPSSNNTSSIAVNKFGAGEKEDRKKTLRRATTLTGKKLNIQDNSASTSHENSESEYSKQGNGEQSHLIYISKGSQLSLQEHSTSSKNPTRERFRVSIHEDEEKITLIKEADEQEETMTPSQPNQTTDDNTTVLTMIPIGSPSSSHKKWKSRGSQKRLNKLQQLKRDIEESMAKNGTPHKKSQVPPMTLTMNNARNKTTYNIRHTCNRPPNLHTPNPHRKIIQFVQTHHERALSGGKQLLAGQTLSNQQPESFVSEVKPHTLTDREPHKNSLVVCSSEESQNLGLPHQPSISTHKQNKMEYQLRLRKKMLGGKAGDDPRRRIPTEFAASLELKNGNTNLSELIRQQLQSETQNRNSAFGNKNSNRLKRETPSIVSNSMVLRQMRAPNFEDFPAIQVSKSINKSSHMSPPGISTNFVSQQFPHNSISYSSEHPHLGLKTRNAMNGSSDNSPMMLRVLDSFNPLTDAQNDSKYDSFNQSIRGRIFEQKLEGGVFSRENLNKTASHHISRGKRENQVSRFGNGIHKNLEQYYKNPQRLSSPKKPSPPKQPPTLNSIEDYENLLQQQLSEIRKKISSECKRYQEVSLINNLKRDRAGTATRFNTSIKTLNSAKPTASKEPRYQTSSPDPGSQLVLNMNTSSVSSPKSSNREDFSQLKFVHGPQPA